MSSTQYTVRNVPAKVDRALRRRALDSGRSLNAVLLDTLAQGAIPGESGAGHSDLDEFIGSWREDPDFDSAIQAFEKIDGGIWQ